MRTKVPQQRRPSDETQGRGVTSTEDCFYLMM